MPLAGCPCFQHCATNHHSPRRSNHPSPAAPAAITPGCGRRPHCETPPTRAKRTPPRPRSKAAWLGLTAHPTRDVSTRTPGISDPNSGAAGWRHQRCPHAWGGVGLAAGDAHGVARPGSTARGGRRFTEVPTAVQSSWRLAAAHPGQGMRARARSACCLASSLQPGTARGAPGREAGAFASQRRTNRGLAAGQCGVHRRVRGVQQ